MAELSAERGAAAEAGNPRDAGVVQLGLAIGNFPIGLWLVDVA